MNKDKNQDTTRTPDKSFSDQIIEESGVIKPTKEVEKEEALSPELKQALGLDVEEAPKEEEKEEEIVKETEEDSIFKQKLLAVVSKMNSRNEEIRKMLPNTKDNSKKLELERELFQNEKEVYELTKDLGESSPQNYNKDLGEVDAFFQETGISKEGESYQLVQKMMKHKASSNLLKVFKMSAKALSKDLKKTSEPVNLATKQEVVPSKNSPMFEEDSITGQVIKNLNKRS